MAYGGGAGKANFGDFSFMMRMNKATPKLMQACANGSHIEEAILTCRKAGDKQQEYMIYKFYDLPISSYQTSASSQEPTESIAFNFAKMEMEYKERMPRAIAAAQPASTTTSKKTSSANVQ